MVRVVVLAVAVALAASVTMAWGFQRQMIYFPSSGPLPQASTVLPGLREVELATEDGLELRAWYLPAPEDGPGVTVLVAPGNAGDRSLRVPLARELGERGLGVLLMDYRGYGGNPGAPSERGLLRDARAARDFLVTEAGVPPGRLLYFGESLGAAVVTALAVEEPPAGLVLRSPFTDLAAVGGVHYPFLPVRLLLRERFPVAELLADLDVPVVVVHGTVDSIVPAEQSREVARAARDLHAHIEVPGANHNDMVLLSGQELVDAVVDLALHVAGRPRP